MLEERIFSEFGPCCAEGSALGIARGASFVAPLMMLLVGTPSLCTVPPRAPGECRNFCKGAVFHQESRAMNTGTR